MESDSKCVSPKWKTPEEVMRFHRLKRKLSGRMIDKERASAFSFSSNSNNSEDSLLEFPVAKRRNPFNASPSPVRKKYDSADESGVEADASSQSCEKTLFQLLEENPKPKVQQCVTSFKNIINHIDVDKQQVSLKTPAVRGTKKIPIDWSLKNKIRFMSTKPFAWTGSKRTCEEVSAVTGFVRCLDPSSKGRLGPTNLDTSPNSQFHQSCLYWQHPHLPWVPLFSKNTSKLSSNLIAAQSELADSLHAEWTIALKSLLQLVRTQQCPYFYIVGTQFQCLFRAAGIAGMPDINAIVTPTTRGFRKMLDREDVTYTMPLRKRRIADESADVSLTVDNVTLDDEDDLDMDELMDSVQFRQLTTAQKACDRKRASEIDGSADSLIMVSGMEVQGLFNLLVNFKLNMDRLPPTLLSPTAFQLATLKSSQVRDSIVQVNGAKLFSVQVDGPVMPHALAQMCMQLDDAEMEYSAAAATFKPTVGFTTVLAAPTEKPSPASFFLKENLSDCGLNKRILSRLCENDPALFGVIDSIEPSHVL